MLDPSHKGFVLSTPSRFYTVVKNAHTTTATRDTTAEEQKIQITVRSPQFEDGLWVYSGTKQASGEWEVEQVDKQA